jgi:hypothetical protein
MTLRKVRKELWMSRLTGWCTLRTELRNRRRAAAVEAGPTCPICRRREGICTRSAYESETSRRTHFRTCTRSATCARAGVPETASDERRGMRETICLWPRSAQGHFARRDDAYSTFPAPAICTLRVDVSMPRVELRAESRTHPSRHAPTAAARVVSAGRHGVCLHLPRT